MTRNERKLTLQIVGIGAALTAVLVVADAAGLLGPLEHWLYDLRARRCQFFTPPPTDRLAHVDIDDRSLESIGPWPWPRSHLAAIVDEVRLAGAKALAMDILITEPQDPRYLPGPDGEFEQVSDDDALCAAVARFDNTLIPFSFAPRQPPSGRAQAMQTLLANQPGLTPQQAVAALGPEHQTPPADMSPADEFLLARRHGVYERIAREMDRGHLSFPQVRDRLLPGANAGVLGGSPLLRTLDSQYNRAISIRSLRRFSSPRPDNTHDTLRATISLAPIAPLAEAAGATGFVNYLADTDGVVRSVPLLIEHDGRLYPQMGLSLALLALDADINDIELGPHRLTITHPDGRRVIPLRRQRSPRLGVRVGALMDIPWFGSQRWSVMYDRADRAASHQHLPVSQIWQVIETQRRLAHNRAQADDALLALLFVLDASRFEQYKAQPDSGSTPHTRQAMIRWTLAELDRAGWLDLYKDVPDDQLTDQDRRLIQSARALNAVARQNALLEEQLAAGRDLLRAHLDGRAVLLGWTATATAADFVPTSLHAECPGVVVHGVIFNAIMTGDVWRRAGPWTAAVMTCLMGLLAAVATARFTPLVALTTAGGLAGAYALINGVLLFDFANTLVGIAGPIAAVLLVWTGCTVARFVIERGERVRITKRFRSYVDPVLVNYVLEHPEMARLDGQVRELTVCFADLSGFTAISETLREHTVPLLSAYMELMVPIIRKRGGYVNKFLGDGIMFFFGAPQTSDTHAADAVATALEMQAAMGTFTDTVRTSGLYNLDQTLSLRCGVASGTMVVGDAGPSDASDYTVLGDTVNLAARLESANKAVGTGILINGRTTELMGDRFLVRPIAKLRVVGKSEGVMVFEPLCDTPAASDALLARVSQTRTVVTAYLRGDFDTALAAIAKVEATQGSDPLTDLYRAACEQHLQAPPGDQFDGHIILERK